MDKEKNLFNLKKIYLLTLISIKQNYLVLGMFKENNEIPKEDKIILENLLENERKTFLEILNIFQNLSNNFSILEKNNIQNHINIVTKIIEISDKNIKEEFLLEYKKSIIEQDIQNISAWNLFLKNKLEKIQQLKKKEDQIKKIHLIVSINNEVRQWIKLIKEVNLLIKNNEQKTLFLTQTLLLDFQQAKFIEKQLNDRNSLDFLYLQSLEKEIEKKKTNLENVKKDLQLLNKNEFLKLKLDSLLTLLDSINYLIYFLEKIIKKITENGNLKQFFYKIFFDNESTYLILDQSLQKIIKLQSCIDVCFLKNESILMKNINFVDNVTEIQQCLQDFKKKDKQIESLNKMKEIAENIYYEIRSLKDEVVCVLINE